MLDTCKRLVLGVMRCDRPVSGVMLGTKLTNTWRVTGLLGLGTTGHRLLLRDTQRFIDISLDPKKSHKIKAEFYGQF